MIQPNIIFEQVWFLLGTFRKLSTGPRPPLAWTTISKVMISTRLGIGCLKSLNRSLTPQTFWSKQGMFCLNITWLYPTRLSFPASPGLGKDRRSADAVDGDVRLQPPPKVHQTQAHQISIWTAMLATLQWKQHCFFQTGLVHIILYMLYSYII